eukprot:16450802-Heterocapsa_arctica.AAC.1
MQDPKEQDRMTEAMSWNMILHTKNGNTGKHSYKVKYWPSLRMAMIKAATEGEEETEVDAQKGSKEPARQGQCKCEHVRQKETVGKTSRTKQPRIAAGRRR